MKRCLFYLLVLGSALAVMVPLDAHAATRSAPRSYLCEEPTTVTVGNRTIGPTPEVCVPFIQWPPSP
jgi:hypothetical protein